MKKQLLSRGGFFIKSLFFTALITAFINLDAQTPAFPGAEGFGAAATGGRGGKVIYVTNLNDSGTGSLRAAIEQSGARTVVFKVSGTIALNSTLKISNDNITIAGQTAPGDGITLRNFPLTISANNVIVRFIRSRMGDTSGAEDDAMNGRNRSNIIIDHCSMSWSVDETASFYDNRNFTMQYCMIYESLYHSLHDKGDHGYGGIWGGKGASFHHNLLAHHTSRNPRFCGSRYSNLPEQEIIDHRNNVIYNWGDNSCYAAEGGYYNIVGNYYKYGPATASSIKDRIIQPWADNGGNSQPAGVTGNFYINDNHIFKNTYTTENNWNGVDLANIDTKDEIRLDNPVTVEDITTHSALEAFERVLSSAGCVLPVRDVLDQRIIQETATGTVHYGGVFRGDAVNGIIDTQGTVGGWPSLSSGTAPVDTDLDGMPDSWEDEMGLNKNSDFDRNGDMFGEGYTNLEYYLNSLVEEFTYILRPISLQVDSIYTRFVYLSWEDIADNETGYVIERYSDGTWTELTTTSANTTSYTDESIDAIGDYYYRLKTINADMESMYTDSVRAEVEELVSARGMMADLHQLKVYPNPAKDMVTISYSLPKENYTELSLIDMTGRRVRNLENAFQYEGIHENGFDVSDLSQGVYFVRLTIGTQSSLSKLIIE